MTEVYNRAMDQQRLRPDGPSPALGLDDRPNSDKETGTRLVKMSDVPPGSRFVKATLPDGRIYYADGTWQYPPNWRGPTNIPPGPVN